MYSTNITVKCSGIGKNAQKSVVINISYTLTFNYSGDSNSAVGYHWMQTWGYDIPYWEAYNYVTFEFSSSYLDDNWAFKINNNVYDDPDKGGGKYTSGHSFSVTYPIKLTQSYNTFTIGIYNIINSTEVSNGVTRVTLYK